MSIDSVLVGNLIVFGDNDSGLKQNSVIAFGAKSHTTCEPDYRYGATTVAILSHPASLTHQTRFDIII
ncbi:hypothetical protein M4755_003205 [Salmonella enterica]|nr:hypothetical protein [Salmonella enterica]EJE5204424.1 hypothetical protein [Salmonella enterica]